MTGTVHSGLLGPSPINIASGAASIYQLVGPAYDLLTTAFPVKVVGISLTIDAQLTLPPGTIGTPLIHPFASVPLDPTNSIATLTISTRGTVVATIPTGSVAEAARSQGGRPQSEGTMPMEPVPGEMWGSLVGCGPALSGSSRLKSRLRA